MFPCGDCEKNYMSARALKAHRRLHTGEGLFTCDQCGKVFIYQSLLTAHMNVHTGEKPYECELCEKSFKSSFGLTIHLRTHLGDDVQDGGNRFKCECGQTFQTSTRFKSHQVVHSGEKPFACSFCQKTFKWRESLKKHLLKHPDANDQSLTQSEKPILVIPSASKSTVDMIQNNGPCSPQQKERLNGPSSTATSGKQAHCEAEIRDEEEDDDTETDDVKTEIVVTTLD